MRPKPSEITLHHPLPFLNTLGRAELEVAAAMIVRTCHLYGDQWRPVTPQLTYDMIQHDVANRIYPFASLAGNPFIRPDIIGLVGHGYAKGIGTPGEDEYAIELTDLLFTKIEKYFKNPVS